LDGSVTVPVRIPGLCVTGTQLCQRPSKRRNPDNHLVASHRAKSHR